MLHSPSHLLRSHNSMCPKQKETYIQCDIFSFHKIQMYELVRRSISTQKSGIQGHVTSSLLLPPSTTFLWHQADWVGVRSQKPNSLVAYWSLWRTQAGAQSMIWLSWLLPSSKLQLTKVGNSSECASLANRYLSHMQFFIINGSVGLL